MNHHFRTGLFALALGATACATDTATTEAPATDTLATANYEKPRVPDWHKNAVIYEVNLRHYTPEGTFAAFQEHLPRLKEMGVDILWFMPVHPISEEKRKGEMGSPYAVGDYYDVNPDHGTMDDFKTLLSAIHDQGMYCIIDWVPNHTGWDNPWITEHPDWYTQDEEGNIVDPIDPNTGESWGWTDVADLNYDNPETRLGMIDAMKFWIKDVGIDGFRVDVAHSVPVDFWAQCTDSLYAVEPVFMLAEAEKPELRQNGSFVADYGWEMHHLLNEIAKTQGANRGQTSQLVQGNVKEYDGEAEASPGKNANHIDSLLAAKRDVYEGHGYHMHFTSNHDENSWAGTEFARMGDGHRAFAVLVSTFQGMPLVYTGQESAMDKRLEFFKKDEVPWGDFAYADFYQTLFELKDRNQAIWNGDHGGPLRRLKTERDEEVFAFTRRQGDDKVVVAINLSAQPQTFALGGNEDLPGNYTEVFTDATAALDAGTEVQLGPWEYRVWSNR